MSHGGARDGAGRKPKWSSQTKLKRVPSALPDTSIDACLRMLETLESQGYNTASMSLEDIIDAYNQALNY